MSVDSNALEEYDYYEDIEPLKWFNFKIIRFILMFNIITILLLNLILTKNTPLISKETDSQVIWIESKR